jgi:hypothetical protein
VRELESKRKILFCFSSSSSSIRSLLFSKWDPSEYVRTRRRRKTILLVLLLDDWNYEETQGKSKAAQ